MERTPLHKQLTDILSREIESGRLQPGDRIPTEMDLCRLYGISRATARQALDTLRELGLVRREVGRGTFVVKREGGVTPQGAVIGVVVARLKGLFVLDILGGIQRAAMASGYVLAVHTSEYQPGGEEAACRQLRERGAQGIILEPSPACGTPPAFLEELVQSGCPAVLVDRYIPGAHVPWVASDNFAGGLALGRHLIRLGRRRLAFLLSREHGTTTAVERVAGVRAAMGEAGVPPEVLRQVVLQGEMLEPASSVVRRTVSSALLVGPMTEWPDAVLCMNDDAASELLPLLHERGIRVPEDIAVTGFDDLPYAASVRPALTTVRQDATGIGEQAAQILIHAILGRPHPTHVALPVELRIRDSTIGAPRRGGPGSSTDGAPDSAGSQFPGA